ncbi:MAG: DUF1080 domain-containing protein [Sedimentisphaerales bacterium]|nr:DUF1080 domain-containing protein [Sedimentisphaerales bacterium]
MTRIHNFKLLVFPIAIFCIAGSTHAKTIMGQYKGTFYPDSTVKMNATACVVDEGDNRYRIAIKAESGDPAIEGAAVEIYGNLNGEQFEINSRAGGYGWKGEINNGHLSARSEYGQHFELDWIESKSPNAEMKPPQDAIILLPYKPGEKADLSAWTNGNWEALDDGVMQIARGKGANRTKQSFSDIKHYHIEFKLPLEPKGRGQGRANSGAYLLDSYEVQILDSFGLVHTSGDCGGLYNLARAKVNASLPPEVWQTYDITFRAARLDDNGDVKEHPRITVIHNGIKIHDNQEIPRNRHRTKGPFQLQDHGHPIQFRNIWVVEG